MAFEGGISPAECILIFSFSFLLFAAIIVRCICYRHSFSDPLRNNATATLMAMTPEYSRTSWRERDARLTGDIQERTLGTNNTTVHVHGWDELRWILQLGPHLLAAAAAHPSSNVNMESPQEVETANQRRQDYIRYSVIHKKVKKAPTSNFPALHQIEPKSDIYVSDENLTNKSDHQRDDIECQAPISVDQRHVVDHSDEHDDLPSVPCCAICLRAYHVGDEIYWSPNPKCCHHFHSACVEMWLLRNDNCPMCRELYLNPPHDENPRWTTPAPPLRADQIEILERGTTESQGRPTRVPESIGADEFMEMMVGIERLYQQANNRMILQTESGHHFHITITRPDSPTLSDIESELFSPIR